MYYTYVLLSLKDNKFYTGYTSDIEKRLKKHNNGEVFFTKSRRPFKLIYFESCLNQEDALHRENYLKTTYGKRYIKNRNKHYLYFVSSKSQFHYICFYYSKQYHVDTIEKNKLLSQLLWGYTISGEDIEAVLKGEKKVAGHYTREMLFQKMLESYSWFTIIQLLTLNEIQYLLTNRSISKLRSPSLRQKYEFVQKRLQQIISVTG